VLREKFDLPIYGVIESAAVKAAAITRTGSVGVIGTQATIRSGAYQRHIAAADPRVHVTARACPLLVPLVENGVDPMDQVAEIVVDRYMAPFDSENIDALIMGCTHYPVYRSALEKRLPGVTMIDVGEALAADLLRRFGQGEGSGTTEYYATERSAAFDEVVRIMDPSVDPAAIRVDNPFM
jgi:glutamate racemase